MGLGLGSFLYCGFYEIWAFTRKQNYNFVLQINNLIKRCDMGLALTDCNVFTYLLYVHFLDFICKLHPHAYTKKTCDNFRLFILVFVFIH